MLGNDRIERGIECLLFARRVRQQVAAQEARQPVEQFGDACGVEFGDSSLYRGDARESRRSGRE
jgi:hypothetical protein